MGKKLTVKAVYDILEEEAENSAIPSELFEGIANRIVEEFS